MRKPSYLCTLLFLVLRLWKHLVYTTRGGTKSRGSIPTNDSSVHNLGSIAKVKIWLPGLTNKRGGYIYILRSNPVEDPIPGVDPTEVQICLSLNGSARNNGRYDASAVNDPGLPVRALARAIGVPSPYYPPLYPSLAELHDLKVLPSSV